MERPLIAIFIVSMAHISVKDHQMRKVSIWHLSVTIILLYVVFLSRLEHGLKYAYGAFRFFKMIMGFPFQSV
jgi:hypothetical protein